jgi:hypothetical protein
LDTTDSAILRLVVDDPTRPAVCCSIAVFLSPSELVVVEMDATTHCRPDVAPAGGGVEHQLPLLLISPSGGKSLLALSMEDNEVAEQILKRHQYSVLAQSDISR